jgi:hypothetical protein
MRKWDLLAIAWLVGKLVIDTLVIVYLFYRLQNGRGS